MVESHQAWALVAEMRGRLGCGPSRLAGRMSVGPAGRRADAITPPREARGGGERGRAETGGHSPNGPGHSQEDCGSPAVSDSPAPPRALRADRRTNAFSCVRAGAGPRSAPGAPSGPRRASVPAECTSVPTECAAGRSHRTNRGRIVPRAGGGRQRCEGTRLPGSARRRNAPGNGRRGRLLPAVLHGRVRGAGCLPCLRERRRRPSKRVGGRFRERLRWELGRGVGEWSR
jgi:hypothetical protein